MEKFQNATPRTVIILFQPNLCYIFPATILTKLADRNFERSHLKEEIEIFVNMGPYGSEHMKTLPLLQL